MFWSRLRRGGFAVSATCWILLSAVVLLCMVTPWTPAPAMLLVSALGLSLAPFLLLPAVLGVVFAVIALRHRWRVVGVVSLVLTASLVAAAVLPTVSLVRVAAERDVPLSAAALFRGPEGGLDGPTTTTTYAEVDGTSLRMDVWQAEGDAAGTRPALIYVFGGGFTSGDRTQWAPFFQHLTSQGISVFAMDYRLSTPENPTWDEAPGDVACAVGWVRQHAADYDVDADRLVLSGGSAGGNLALLTAYSAGTGAITPSCAVGDTSVRAVVDFYGPFDLAETARTTASADVTAALEQYLGASADEEPERYARLSPSTYVSADTPPTLVLQGGHDTGVPVSQSSELASALEAAGVAHDLVVLPATQHGFDAVFGSLANQIAQAEVSRFIAEHVTNG